MIRYSLLSLVFFSKTIKAAEEKGGMPQLNPESFTSQIFWLTLLFVFLFLMNHFIFLPKVQNIRNKRKDKIEGYIKEAKKINDSINSIIEKIHEDLEKAKNEKNLIINKTFEENKKILDRKFSEINEEFEIKKNKLGKAIEANKTSILSNLPSLCVTLSDNLYEKIMNEKTKGSVKEFKQIVEDD